jgi:glycosyltransferase involved in cell wall biosynthesis
VSNVIARSYFHHEARLLQDFEKSTAADFAAHITCSDLDRARWLALVPNANTVTIPNGVDCEYFSSGSTEIRRCSLVFVGTMDWYPNLEAMSFFLKEIWPAVKHRAPSATMDIAGSNPPKSLRHLARSLPGVTVHGYIPDVRPLIESAALYVCPIRDGGGTKLKILDAFAMKKCVVAHPIACEGINVIADVNVVLATSAAEFVETIVTLLADHERCQTIGEAARGLVESQYSFRAIGAQFRAALCDTAEAHQRRPS